MLDMAANQEALDDGFEKLEATRRQQGLKSVAHKGKDGARTKQFVSDLVPPEKQ